MTILNKLPDDIINILLNNMDYHTLGKWCSLSDYTNKIGSTNELWKPHYDSFFDRMVITNNSTHIGAVTWARCNVGDYPGWEKMHDPVDLKCKCKEHYFNLEKKVLKRQFKNYKEQTFKKYYKVYRSKRKLLWNTNKDRLIAKYEESISSYQREVDKLKNLKYNIEIMDQFNPLT